MSEEVLAAVGDLLLELRGAGADVKWARPEALHLTLKFLGEIAPEQVETVKSVLSETVPTHPRFELRVGDIGGFPSLRNPRVIWAGVSAASELIELQAALERALSAAGFEREDRPYTPHLTLGRIRSRRNMAETFRILDDAGTRTFGRVDVTQVVLMESRLRPEGPEYVSLLETDLGTAR